MKTFLSATIIATILAAATSSENNNNVVDKDNSPCRGSPAFVHAKCLMEITFPLMDCDNVQEEITRRIVGDYGWTDPHNNGLYQLDGSTRNGNDGSIMGSHLSGNGQYTDLFGMTFTQDESTGNCVVSACSESQVTSVIDFSTNYCNLRNLYCNYAKDGCPIIYKNFKYTESYTNCNQRDESKCNTVPSDEKEKMNVREEWLKFD